MGKGKVKILGNMHYEINLDNALFEMHKEDSQGFTRRVTNVYMYEATFGTPSLAWLAYQVFLNYHEPIIETIIEKSTKTQGPIELDLIHSKSKTPKDQQCHDMDLIREELEEHVRKTYKEFESSLLLKVKKVIDDLNLSHKGKYPIAEVW
ncbi:hypothetical protein [Halobacillus halophilus]|uniref:hypothetical protein n=1 Tax=Halobacillus halophilus TaxID=1570 RepID=UPI001CD60076|nr:hypothetical protein [Halobacillus halophilus]MCA1010372.1 hypothetical protein [Halobacillus halophilus]